MTQFIRLCRAELRKFRHTLLFPIHLLMPVIGSALFLFYYKLSGYDELTQIMGYVQVLGMVLTFLSSVVCAKAVELEEEGHFQTFLGTIPKKGLTLTVKWVVLACMGLLSILAAIVFFAVGYRWILGHTGVGMEVWLKLTAAISLGSLPLYLLHLFLNLRFSKLISLGWGIAQLLMAALLTTELGDGIWQFIPCSWSARFGGNTLLGIPYPQLQREYGICLLITVAFCAIIFVWFHNYEGRACND